MGRFDINGVGLENSRGYVWDSTVLTWVKAVQAGGGGGGSTQVTVSGVLDSSNASVVFGDSVNKALRVNVVAGAAGGSTVITMSAALDSSGGAVTFGDSANSALRVNVVAGAAGGSTVVTVSAFTPSKLNIGSTAADNAVLISGNSTVIQGTNPWVIGGNSSVRANLSSTAADNPVAISGNSTVIQGTNPWVIGGNSSVRANLSSTAADNPVVVSGNSTVFQGGAPWSFSETMQSSVAPSSGSSGVIVRQVIDNILTTASTNAFAASTSLSIQSSGAGLRSYVTVYSILSTNAGPTKVKFYSSGTMTWPMIFAAVSSAVSGANLAVSAPSYIFRTNTAEALTLQLGSGGSTVGGFQVAVSYFRAP